MRALPPETIENVVRAALAEDVGAGDLTSECAIPAEVRAAARLVARDPGVVAGLPLVEAVFRQLDPGLTIECGVADGAVVAADAEIARLRGRARPLLTGERTALNFLQRLSGVATLTRQFVEAVAGTNATIRDTRKTTPTLRALEKYAVAVGGGENHRLGLFDAVMIKDNHRAVLARLGAGALSDAVRAARRRQPPVPVIVEADTLDEVEQAVAAGADQVLLDNMSVDELREAVRLVGGRARTEASGGVRLSTVRAIAETGVDYISIGALTHSARAVDVSLELVD
ncbi:carboxylating nicotinate-nucleotide diphosphorylase [bacterium]|nr:carboxylating nicotinate-nucleotide diphosphorylase [bacterium]